MHSPGISRQAEGRQKKEKHSKQTFPGIRFGELSSSKNSMKKLNIIFHTISEIDRIYSTTYKIHVLPCVFEETTPPETAHFKVIQNNSSPECLKVEVDLSSRCLFFFSPTFFPPEVIFTLWCLPSGTNTRASLQQTPATSTPIYFSFRHTHTHTPSADSLSLLADKNTLSSICRLPF